MYSLTLPVTMLSIRPLCCATVLPNSSYYTVVASIFLVSAASCKAICRVALVRTLDYSQPKVARPSNATHANTCLFAYAQARVPGTLVLFYKVSLFM